MRTFILAIALVTVGYAAEPPAPAATDVATAPQAAPNATAAASTTDAAKALPAAPNATATAASTTDAAKASPAAPKATPAAPSEMTDEQRVAEAKKMGYRIVNENGETLYCQKSMATGSHVRRETTCLTQKEMDFLRQQSQDGLRRIMTPLKPQQGG
jgi:chemotaxis protein histidine kinase CheA